MIDFLLDGGLFLVLIAAFFIHYGICLLYDKKHSEKELDQ